MKAENLCAFVLDGSDLLTAKPRLATFYLETGSLGMEGEEAPPQEQGVGHEGFVWIPDETQVFAP